MSVRQTILAQLIASPNRAVERIVGDALPYATGQEQLELAEVLLQRNHRAGWVALIRCFDHLSPELQRQLLNRPRDLFGPLADSMEEESGPSRGNVIAIVRQAADPKLAFLLTDALSDGREEVRTAAADSLLEAVRTYLRHRQEARASAGETAYDPADGEHLRRAVDFGLRQFRAHRNPQIVLAALLFERQHDSPLWGVFADPHDPATRIAVQYLRILREPALAAAALLAMGSAIRSAAAAGLTNTDSPAAFDALAQESFRLLDPALQASQSMIPRPRLLENPPADPPWNQHNILGYLRLIENLGTEPSQKLAWLTHMAATAPSGPAGRLAKLAVMRAIMDLNLAESVQAILPLSRDADETVARCAARYVLWRRTADWRSQAGDLLQSPHGSVRRLVSMALSPGQFERLWHQYRKLPPAVQVLSTRALVQNDAQFTDMLRTKLTSANPVDNAQGLKMLLACPNQLPFRDQVIALCGHADARIAATAVRLVGRLEDPRLRDLLEIAARHEDPRVRANAIESMEQLHVADRSQQVLAMLASRFSRERANAIKAISQFDFATSRECLLRMLTDSSPQHRISALWVVGQMGLLDIARLVGTMARRDPNPHVRNRADELLEKLQQATVSA